MSSQKIKQINVGVIGTGWCGGIRANSCAGSPLVNELHIAETNPQRLKEVKLETSPVTAVVDYPGSPEKRRYRRHHDFCYARINTFSNSQGQSQRPKACIPRKAIVSLASRGG